MDLRTHLLLKEAKVPRICAQWITRTHSLHPRVVEPPRRSHNTRTDGSGWRQVVEYSPMGRGTALGGAEGPPFQNFSIYQDRSLKFSAHIWSKMICVYVGDNLNGPWVGPCGGPKGEGSPISQLFYLSRSKDEIYGWFLEAYSPRKTEYNNTHMRGSTHPREW